MRYVNDMLGDHLLTVINQRFWVHYRQCLCVPIAHLSYKKSKDVQWPIYRTDEDFERAGSKVKKLIQLIQYHLKHPHAPQVDSWNEETGDMNWPQVADEPAVAGRLLPKILVFFYFAAMADTLVSVCSFFTFVINIHLFLGYYRHSH